jgi:hypothetical protein
LIFPIENKSAVRSRHDFILEEINMWCSRGITWTTGLQHRAL